MANVRRTPDAEDDLVGVWLYIAEQSQSPEIADGVLDRIGAKCRLYATQPEAATRRFELAPKVHSFVVNNFVVLYRACQDGIEVLRVIHGARDVDVEFRKRLGPNSSASGRGEFT